MVARTEVVDVRGSGRQRDGALSERLIIRSVGNKWWRFHTLTTL